LYFNAYIIASEIVVLPTLLVVPAMISVGGLVITKSIN
jgi:hypothetical protein